MIKEALWMGWVGLGWLSQAVGSLRAPLVLIMKISYMQSCNVVEIMIGVKMTCQMCLYAQQVTPTTQLSLQAPLKNFRNAQQRGLNEKKVERMFPLFSFVTFYMKI